VAKSLIHHHFGSKEELWGRIKHAHMRDYQVLRDRLIVENGQGASDIGAAIRAHFAFLSDRPRMVRIFGWMMLEALGEDYVEVGGDMIKVAASKLQRAQAAGRLRSDFQPVFAVLTFVSATEHWLRVREALAPTLLDVDLQTADEWFLRNLVDIIVHGVSLTTPVTPEVLNPGA
jgi:TetR/AcrR family transcriptional regulator